MWKCALRTWKYFAISIAGMRLAKYFRKRLVFHFFLAPQALNTAGINQSDAIWHKKRKEKRSAFPIGRRQLYLHPILQSRPWIWEFFICRTTVTETELAKATSLLPTKRTMAWEVSLFINFEPNISQFGTRIVSTGEVNWLFSCRRVRRSYCQVSWTGRD